MQSADGFGFLHSSSVLTTIWVEKEGGGREHSRPVGLNYCIGDDVISHDLVLSFISNFVAKTKNVSNRFTMNFILKAIIGKFQEILI